MAVAVPAELARPQAVKASWTHSPGRAGYLFLLPWLIGFFGLTLGPALASLYLSFTDFDLLRDPRWIGLANYERIFTSDREIRHLDAGDILLCRAWRCRSSLCFALAIAMMLNRGIAGLPWYRALFYLPSLLGASVAIAVLWRQIFAGDGLVNQFLALVRDRRAELDLQSGLLALHTGCAERLAVRLADDHLPRRIAADPGRDLRGRRNRRGVQIAAVLAHHAAAADAGYFV